MLVAAMLCLLGGAGAAFAAGALASWSERQVVPGPTERTIWGRDQVYVYRLPQNVTHTGDLHVELTYTPADRDCFIYLLGPVTAGSTEWQVCPGTYGQGFLSLWPGREVVDYAVPEVLDQEPQPEGVRGDAYYVVVQAANGVSRFRLSGYLPRTVAGSTDTISEATFTRVSFKAPAKAGATLKVAGAPYGGPFDFTPTSQGRAEVRLQYPAAPAKRRVTPASPALTACFEQYVYPTLWEPVGAEVPVSQPADYAHWALYDLNRHAAAPLAGDDWYGLQASFVVRSSGPWQPRKAYHYVPVLWLAGAAPYATAPAPPGPPATGLRTVGYKATLLLPQNLRLASATARVRRGRRVVLKGTLAMPADSTPEASVAWAPPGTLVTVQRKAGKTWVTARKVRTRADGTWRAALRVRRTTLWRAVAQPAPGLAMEYSLVKRTVVRR